MATTIANATKENISVKVAGNWFNWGPEKSRVIQNDGIAKFIQMELTDSGLYIVPTLVGEDEEVTPEELAERKEAAREQIEVAKQTALERYIAKHRAVIYNNQVSLRRDLEMKNIKADPAAFASEGEINSMRLVAKYQKGSEDAEQAKIDEVKKLMGAVKGK